MVNTILEIVQTGSQFTAFILEPLSIKPENVVTSSVAETAKQIATSLHPTAIVVDAKVFAGEINTRMQQILG